MVLELKFDSISELAELQRLAVQADKPVYIANEDDSIRVDARSFLGLFALDYSKPLKVITDSLYAMRMLEIQQRNRAAHMPRACGGYKQKRAEGRGPSALFYSLQVSMNFL